MKGGADTNFLKKQKISLEKISNVKGEFLCIVQNVEH